jgi:hypothetical protein
MDHKSKAAGDLDPVREACRVYSRNPGPLAKASGVGHCAIESYINGGRLGADARRALARAVAVIAADAPPRR